MKHTITPFLLLVSLAILTFHGSAQVKYRIIDLGTLGVGLNDGSFALAINDSSQIVGYFVDTAASNRDGKRGFLWQHGAMTDLSIGDTIVYRAWSINEHGEIAVTVKAGFGWATYIWRNDSLILISPAHSAPYAINNSTQMSALFQGRCVFWDHGSVFDFKSLVDTTNHWVELNNGGLNDLGHVIGVVRGYVAAGTGSFLWKNGSLDFFPMWGEYAFRADQINNLDHVVGQVVTTDSHGYSHGLGIMWRDGLMTDLGVPGDVNFMSGINDHDEVVGDRSPGGTFYWKNGLTTDLKDAIDPDSGWTIYYVTAINQKGEIVGSGFHNGKWRAFLLTDRAEIIHPQARNLLIAGEADTIRWAAPAGKQLRIEFSDDNGTTYYAVATNVRSDSNHYEWNVPPALSRKCRIRLIDIANENILAVSDSFFVKGYELTRFRSDSSYERFRPNLHAWSFPNEEDLMWPESWWQQFDYQTGNDPLTNQLYPNSRTFTEASSNSFVDWPLFTAAFGVSQCYLSLSPPVYDPIATIFWEQTRREYNGVCVGFPISALMDFDFEQAFLTKFPNLGNHAYIYDLWVNDERRMVVNQMWEYQFGAEHQAFQLQHNIETPVQTLQNVKDMFRSETVDDRYLFLSGRDRSAAHGLVPYKLVRFPGNTFNLYVYDCNLPGDSTRYVFIDSTANYWYYQSDYFDYSGNAGCYLMDAASTYFHHPVIGVPQEAIPVASGGTTPAGYFTLLNSQGANTTIVDENGKKIGFRDSSTFQTMQNAIPIVPITNTYHPPIGYYVPSGHYSISISGIADSLSHVSLFADSVVYGYRRHDALPGQTDLLNLGREGFSSHNNDTSAKSADFKTIIKEAGARKIFDVNGFSMQQNDSSFFGPKDHDRLTLVNSGSQKTYSLELEFASTTGESRFLQNDVVIPANSSEEIVPQWSDLSQPVYILVDNGNDGSIDDTVIIGNILGVEQRKGREIPKEFSLAQNFPNPFNPLTVIRYQLPVDGWVTLKVYDILGREVATLVDERQAVGFKQVEFDAAQYGGISSGVYIYKLTSGSFVDSKTMMLVK